MLIYISRDKGFNKNKVRISAQEPAGTVTQFGSVNEKVLYRATSENSVRIEAEVFKGIFDFLPEEGDCFIAKYIFDGIDKLPCHSCN